MSIVERICKQCGTTFSVRTGVGSGKAAGSASGKKIYCTPQCARKAQAPRAAAYRKEQRAKAVVTQLRRYCKFCGRPFTVSRGRGTGKGGGQNLYCSDTCKAEGKSYWRNREANLASKKRARERSPEQHRYYSRIYSRARALLGAGHRDELADLRSKELTRIGQETLLAFVTVPEHVEYVYGSGPAVPEDELAPMPPVKHRPAQERTYYANWNKANSRARTALARRYPEEYQDLIRKVEAELEADGYHPIGYRIVPAHDKAVYGYADDPSALLGTGAE